MTGEFHVQKELMGILVDMSRTNWREPSRGSWCLLAQNANE